jgi:molybdopterin synthase sulfur carrier subunit
MDRLPTTSSSRETSVSSGSASTGAAGRAAPPSIRVRYWAAIKAAAGTGGDVVSGATVAEVLSAVRSLYVDNPRFGAVLDVCSVVLGERPLGTVDLSTVPVEDGDVIDLLPPFAGG